MSAIHCWHSLSGINSPNDDTHGVKLKSFNELLEIGEASKNRLLVWHVYMDQMCVKFWFREYISVVTLSDMCRPSRPKRILEIFRVFWEGIAALCLARDTQQPKWRKIGEESIATMSRLVNYSRWNFENKLLLMKAEYFYLNEDYSSAELAYEASIASAHKQHLLHEEALAYELYGIYFIENHQVDKAMELLNVSIQKYVEWGALKKVEALKSFIGLFDLALFKTLNLTN